MLGYLDLADADGNAVRLHGDGQPNRRITNVQGLPGLGFAAPRDSTYSRPSGHGGITRSRWMSAALITIDGWVRGASQEEVQDRLDELSVPLLDALDTPRTLTWRRGATGVELQAQVRLAGSLNTDVVSSRIIRFQVSLRADDPRGFAQELSTSFGGTLATGGGITAPITAPISADPSPGGTVAVNNTGTRPTPPLIRVYGLAADGVQIVLVGTSQRISLTGTIASGDYVEVDVVARTVKLNGTSPAQGMVDSAGTTWFDLPRGTSTIRLFAATSDALTRCDVLYRPAYA